jgi:hypothetical protein
MSRTLKWPVHRHRLLKTICQCLTYQFLKNVGGFLPLWDHSAMLPEKRTTYPTHRGPMNVIRFIFWKPASAFLTLIIKYTLLAGYFTAVGEFGFAKYMALVPAAEIALVVLAWIGAQCLGSKWGVVFHPVHVGVFGVFPIVAAIAVLNIDALNKRMKTEL